MSNKDRDIINLKFLQDAMEEINNRKEIKSGQWETSRRTKKME